MELKLKDKRDMGKRIEMYVEAIDAPLTGVWAFIDGTLRGICRPTYEQKRFYNGWKRKHALKFQSLITPDGMIAALDGLEDMSLHHCVRVTGWKSLKTIFLPTLWILRIHVCHF
jgi:hypothetical protein